MGNTKRDLYHVISFSEFFPGQTLDIRETLKRFSREELINAVAVLSLNYGNAFLPDPNSTFFSESSHAYINELNNRYTNYARKHLQDGCKRVCYCSYRTTLQLLRYIFSIPSNEYQNTILEQDFEYVLFQVLTAINEEIYEVKNDSKDPAELYFYLEYAMNDMNQPSLNQTVIYQCYCANMLFEFLQTSPLCKELYPAFLREFNIQNWKEYESTILSVYVWFEFLKGKKVNPTFDVANMAHDIRSKLSVSTLDKLSMPFDAYIAFDSEDKNDRNNNVDYRGFRGSPLIKTPDGYYHLVNHQMIAELIYNSLYFLLSKLYRGNFSSFFNKRFVEEYLFHRTMLDIIKQRRDLYFFPDEATILSTKAVEEEANQPDFYMREQSDLFIFECKAFKINGLYKEGGSICALVEEFYKKAVHGVNKKGKDDNQGVRQLVGHILRIEDDEFKWDEGIPDDVSYHPVIVFEDPKLVNDGIACKIQEWYNEELKRTQLVDGEFDPAFYPVVTLSISTLFRYRKVFKRNKWSVIMNRYLETCAIFNRRKGWVFKPVCSFDDFMQCNYEASKDEVFIRFYQDLFRT